MSHVLEHFDNAANGLRKILDSCKKLGVQRVIVIVPGRKGFDFDVTHRTFVNLAYLEENGLTAHNGYQLAAASYFPLNIEAIGRYFTFHELMVIYDVT